MRKSRIAVVTALAATALLGVSGPAEAAATKTLASWTMNEKAGSTVLVDTSGHGINGTIGTHVVANGAVETFPYVQGGVGGVYDPAHIDLLNSSQLNPGTRDFAVTIRFKFTIPVGDVLQKGQSGAVGGLFKIELDSGGGKVDCSFVSPTGSAQVWSSRTVNDGLWHVVTCTRTATQVTVTVDGAVVGTIVHSTGSISNTWPLSIGGKSKCNQTKVFCDYFAGQIDYVKILTS
jgi:hypothetical protein